MKLIQKFILVVLALSFVGVLSISQQVEAISPTAFRAERIIDDSVFYNTKALPSAQAVQDFINSHTPACDTWGTQPSGYGSLNRAQYAQQIKGWPGPPYACLQNYHENPSNGQTSFENGGGWFSGGQSAGKIIWDAAQQYGINPQVLLVFLKKESAGPLFSDSWPLKSQYKYAMGYACPDSGPNYSAACVESKGGFYKQVNLAAWQLRYYVNNISSYNYQPGRWNYIQYDTDPACGGKNVYIENIATASLYIYTPYTPTQAALAAYPGQVNCGAYGNRNFFMFFNEWFGSTNAEVTVNTPLTVKGPHSTGLYTKVPTTVSFTMKNNRNYGMGMGSVGVVVRDSQGRNLDYPLQQAYLPPNGSFTYTSSQVLPRGETYTFSIVNYINGEWKTDSPESSSVYNPRILTLPVSEMPTQTSSITFNNELRAGRSTTVGFHVTNNSAASSVNAGRFAVAIRGPNGENFDLPPDTVTLSANQTYHYYKTFKPPKEGKYTFFIASTLDNGQTWESNFPLPHDETIQSNLSANVKPAVTQIGDLSFGSSVLHVDKTETGTFKLHNYSDDTVNVGGLAVAVRGPGGINADLPLQNVSIPANQDYTYSLGRLFNRAGTYTAWITRYSGGVWDDTTYPLKETADILRRITFEVKPNPTQTASVSMGSQPIRVGQSATGSFTIHNFGDEIVSIGAAAIAIRGPGGINNDMSLQQISIPAGGDFVYSASSPIFTQPGTYTAWLTSFRNGVWDDSIFPAVESLAVNRRITFEVKPSPTVTESIVSDILSPSKNQTVTLSFKVRNYGTSSVSLGRIGISGRDPLGRNVDPGASNVTLNAGEERIISYVVTPTMSGNYTYTIISTKDNGLTWQSGPVGESSSVLKTLTLQVTP